MDLGKCMKIIQKLFRNLIILSSSLNRESCSLTVVDPGFRGWGGPGSNGGGGVHFYTRQIKKIAF